MSQHLFIFFSFHHFLRLRQLRVDPRQLIHGHRCPVFAARTPLYATHRLPSLKVWAADAFSPACQSPQLPVAQSALSAAATLPAATHVSVGLQVRELPTKGSKFVSRCCPKCRGCCFSASAPIQRCDNMIRIAVSSKVMNSFITHLSSFLIIILPYLVSSQTCQNTCGHVPIKYPFGTGAGCGDPRFTPYVTCTGEQLTFTTHRLLHHHHHRLQQPSHVHFRPHHVNLFLHSAQQRLWSVLTGTPRSASMTAQSSRCSAALRPPHRISLLGDNRRQYTFS